jgi:peroxiredoxin
MRLLRLSLVAELRSPSLRFLGLASALGAGAYAWTQDGSAAGAAMGMAVWLGRAYGISACLWLGYAAVRDQNEQLGGVLRSKPVDGAFWVGLNWAVGQLLWLFLLLCPFLGAALGDLVQQGPIALLAYGLGWGRAALGVAFAGTISYALSRSMRSPLGGLLTLFAWFCAMVGFGYIPAFLQPDYSQNRPLYLSLAAVLLAVAALFVERYRRGELRRPLAAVGIVALLLLLTAAGTTRAYQLAPDPTHQAPGIWSQIGDQHLEIGRRVPGFWLPDGRGGQVRTADHAGKILIIYLFAGADPDAGRSLLALDTLRRRYQEQGVQPLGVCISPDHGDGWMLARTSGIGFPIGSDLRTESLGKGGSPILTAYDAEQLPMVVITDRARIVREISRTSLSESDDLTAAIERRLKDGG